MHSNKKDQNLKVGNLLTFEGGAPHNVPAIGGAFGIAYHLQNKVSDDSGTDVPERSPGCGYDESRSTGTSDSY